MNVLNQLNIKNRGVGSSDSPKADRIENSLAQENSYSRYKFSFFQSENSLELTEYFLQTKQD